MIAQAQVFESTEPVHFFELCESVIVDIKHPQVGEIAGVEAFQAVGAQTQYAQSRQDAVRLEVINRVVVCIGQQERKLAKTVVGLAQATHEKMELSGEE